MSKRGLDFIKNNKGVVVGAVMGLALASGVAAAMSGIGQPAPLRDMQGAQAIRVQQLTPIKPPAGAPMSFADMIERVSPAVVAIEARGRPNAERPQEVRSAGSGFFISADGYVVTNNHVIENTDEIELILKNDKRVKAKIVGRDPATDLAVLKVDGKNYPFVAFELKHKPRVGDWVVAVGNPFGFAGTATAGIVSGYGRNLNDGGNYIDYLQIDAAINRGNSGGPTFDLYGRVIGVNTIIVSPSGANAGVGFAIPADVANKITSQLMKGAKIERGYIGVSIITITDETAKALGLTSLEGAYVSEITPEGPSDKAGVQLGDIIVSVNGKPVKSPTELTRRIADIRAGEKLALGVLRNNKPLTLTLTAALRPSEDQLGSGPLDESEDSDDEKPDSKQPMVEGLSLRSMTQALRDRYSIEASIQGAVVVAVDPESDAGQKGMRPGDVIIRADNRVVASNADFSRIVDELKKAKRPSILLLVNRAGRNVPLPIELK
jgi:serine protease Do